MRIIIFTIFLSLGLFANNTTYKIGVLINTFFDDANLSKMILKSIEKKINSLDESTIKLVSYTKEKEILADFLDNKIKFIVVNPEVFFRNEKEVSPHIYNKKWTVYISQNNYEEYYLIKHKDSKANFSNLSQYQVNFKEGVASAKYWLESEIYKAYKKSYFSVIKEENFIKKRNRLALKPYFNKNHVSVIDKSDFDLIAELNPILRKELSIIKKSEPIFFSLMGLSNKAIPQSEISDLYALLSKADYLLSGDDLTTIIPSVSKLYVLEDSDVEVLSAFYKNYFTLKDKYD